MSDEEHDDYSGDEFMDDVSEEEDDSDDEDKDENEADDDDTTCVMNLTSSKKLHNDVLEINEILKTQKI